MIKRFISYPAIIGSVSVLLLTLLPFSDTAQLWGGSTQFFIALWAIVLLLFVELFRLKCVLTFTLADGVFLLFVFYCLLRNVAAESFSWGDVFLLLYLVLLYVWGKLLQGNTMKVLMAGLLSTGICQSLIAWLQYLGVTPSLHYAFLCTGSFPNPAPLAGVLALSVTVTFYLLLHETTGWRKRLLLFVTLLLMLPVCVWADSRAAWLALAVGVCGVLFKRWKVHVMWKVLLAFVLLLSVAPALYRYKQVSADSRVLIWKVCAEIGREHCWVGDGNGAVERNYMPHLGEYLSAKGNSKDNELAANNIYAFNEVLELYCSYGLMGVMLLAVALFAAVCRAGRGSPLAVLLSVYGVLALFSYPSRYLSLLTYLVLLLSATDGTGRKVKFTPRFSVLCVVLLCMLMGGFSMYKLRCNRVNHALNECYWEKECREYLQEQYAGFSTETPLVAAYGKSLFMQKRYAEAVPVLEQLIRLRPTLDVYTDLGISLQHTKAYEEAERCFSFAAQMLPTYMTPRYRLFKLYQESGQEQKALQEAEVVMTMKVKVDNETTRRMRSEVERWLQ